MPPFDKWASPSDVSIDTIADLLQKTSNDHGGGPVEAFVQLLDRLGRHDEALDALLDFVAKQPEAAGQATSLRLELAQKSGNFGKVAAYYRDQHDVLGYATATLCAAASNA